MSEHEIDRNEPVPGRVPSPGPPVVPDQDSDDADRQTREAQEREDSEGGPVPGEDPEDNPDLKGEERFDAG